MHSKGLARKKRQAQQGISEGFFQGFSQNFRTFSMTKKENTDQLNCDFDSESSLNDCKKVFYVQ